jgi:hypothetical protein
MNEVKNLGCYITRIFPIYTGFVKSNWFVMGWTYLSNTAAKNTEFWWGNIFESGHIEDNIKIDFREKGCEDGD